MLAPLLAALAGQSPPYGEVALAIAFGGFLLVIVEVTLVRRREALEHDLRLPLDEARPVAHSSDSSAHSTSTPGPKGGANHEHA